MREEIDTTITRKLWKERVRTRSFPRFPARMDAARKSAVAKLDIHLNATYGENATLVEDHKNNLLVINGVMVVTP